MPWKASGEGTDEDMEHLSADQLVKQGELEAILSRFGRVALAFSGGVDSSFLLWEAVKVLGAAQVLALTGDSPAVPERELGEARAFCERLEVEQLVFETREMQVEGFCENPENRCYLCKDSLLAQMEELAGARGFAHVCEGSNASDAQAWRPGADAVREHGVASPLADAGLSKADIRVLAREEGLRVWDKPSFSCLYTRFPYGERLDLARVDMVGRAEQFLRDLGFANPRVRSHVGGIARIEVDPGEIRRAAHPEMREVVVSACKAFGFSYVSLDLEGYRSGSMDEVL